MNERSWIRLSKQERQELGRLLHQWFTAGADGAASLGSAATGRRATHPPCGEERRVNPEDRMADQPTLSARRLGTGVVRAATAGKNGLLDAQHRQRIVALACGPAPEGRARWTVRLLTEEVVKRKLVPRVGRETIRVLLESHDLKPWREKNVVRGGTG